mmetsp:Transcript_10843/g.14127  ORF Transcript_10843/g.14127 Transcript_10843/m.14127 type:complete len:275 (+) Transcript_10843:63-887(+)
MQSPYSLLHLKIPFVPAFSCKILTKKPEAKQVSSRNKMSLPELGHFSFREYENFYEPSEDTFLLVDAIQMENDRRVFEDLCPMICIEIGSGSGCVITFLAQTLAKLNLAPILYATDINEDAATATKLTAEKNQIQNIEVLQTSFADAIAERVKNLVDILVFNPPYVPTSSDEVGSRGITAAWAGGEDGREVIDQFLPKVKNLLSPKGLFYMIVVEENKPQEVARIMDEEGFNAEIILSRRAKNELLSVMKFWNKQDVDGGRDQSINIRPHIRGP